MRSLQTMQRTFVCIPLRASSVWWLTTARMARVITTVIEIEVTESLTKQQLLLYWIICYDMRCLNSCRQIHTRLVYLRHLIVSLAQARDIENTLIIFSHDYYDEEINDLVQSVDFAKVMQIFYPHSIQTHPHEFPGESPGDCPRDITIEQLVSSCLKYV